MTLQLGALRDALLDAGAKPEKADRAAEEVAGYEREFAEIKSELRLLKWMVASNAAITLIVLGLVLRAH